MLEDTDRGRYCDDSVEDRHTMSSRSKIMKLMRLIEDFSSWRSAVEKTDWDCVCEPLIDAWLDLYSALVRICPPLGRFKPKIIETLETRKRSGTFIFMIGIMIGMLYVAYAYVYMPAADASFVQWACFHGCLGINFGMDLWILDMLLVTDPGVIPDVSWHDLPTDVELTNTLLPGQALACLLSMVLTPFFGGHCWLLSKNMTTFEYLSVGLRFECRSEGLSLVQNHLELRQANNQNGDAIPEEDNKDLSTPSTCASTPGFWVCVRAAASAGP